MNILLDECVPKRLGRHLAPHAIKTVPQAGWSGIKNGRLLALAESMFDVFLTVDKSLNHQQNVAQFNIAIILLDAERNELHALLPFLPQALAALETIQPGDYVEISE